MRKLHSQILYLVIACTGIGSRLASAQDFDPRAPLLTLIQAFQNCGPPQVYQMLSPQLFQTVAQQTNGQGCYQQIRAAGPVLDAQVLDQRQFAIGPLYVIRVTHQTGAVDWFIGFNQVTGKVELLTFQSAVSSTPTIQTGPSPRSTGPSPASGSTHPRDGSTGGKSPSSSGSGDDGCDLYPAMCE
jgi:hypothetical protein